MKKDSGKLSQRLIVTKKMRGKGEECNIFHIFWLKPAELLILKCQLLKYDTFKNAAASRGLMPIKEK